jgi:hypothetical protein
MDTIDEQLQAYRLELATSDEGRALTSEQFQQRLSEKRQELIDNDPRTIAFKENMAKREAERHAAEEARRKAYEAEKQQHAQAEQGRHKARALESWTAAGGASDEFEQEWPAMWREMLSRKVLAGEDARRAQTARTW